jgi:hypothetical protein
VLQRVLWAIEPPGLAWLDEAVANLRSCWPWTPKIGSPMTSGGSSRPSSEDLGPSDEPLAVVASALLETEGNPTEAAQIILESPAESLADDRIERERERLGTVGRWRFPLDGLDLLIAYASEAGGLWNDRYGKSAFSEPAYRARALHQLWGLSVTVGYEVLTLLSAGLGLGAFARWRTLYEAQVLARVIGLGDDETALRFLDREDLRNAAATLRWHIGAKRDRRLDRLGCTPSLAVSSAIFSSAASVPSSA